MRGRQTGEEEEEEIRPNHLMCCVWWDCKLCGLDPGTEREDETVSVIVTNVHTHRDKISHKKGRKKI